jgi:hypothetical protein
MIFLLIFFFLIFLPQQFVFQPREVLFPEENLQWPPDAGDTIISPDNATSTRLHNT